MDETVGSLSKGSRVWFKQDAETWMLAEIKENSNGKPSVALLSGHPGKLLQGVEPSKLVPANPELQQAIADLTQLSYLNEPSILDNLFQRYGGDCIYTNAGPVLIAVNPCRNLPLYTSQVADQYKGELLLVVGGGVDVCAETSICIAGSRSRSGVKQAGDSSSRCRCNRADLRVGTSTC